MKTLDYNKLCNSILSISKEAGKEILKIYTTENLGVTYKDDKTPLTLADKASNKVILFLCSSFKTISVLEYTCGPTI